MSNNGRFAEDGNPGAGTGVRKEDSPSVSPAAVKREPASTKASRVHYPDMQSAARFPIKLPILVKSKSGSNAADTENISANVVLFHMYSARPICSTVVLTLSLPADVVWAQ